MEINYVAITVATVAQFIASAIWYMPVFGGVWGKMHGFDQLSPAAQKDAQSHMMPLLGVQLLLTLVTTFVLALFIGALPAEWNVYGIAGFFWLGFMMPTQVSAVLFGGTAPRWVVQKSLIMVGASLLNVLIAVAILQLF